MKKILSLIIAFWCIIASAQVTPTGYLFRNTNERVRLGKFDGLHLPAYGTTGFVSGQYLGAGAIRLDTTGSDKGVYVWYDGVWNRIASGTDSYSIYTADSTIDDLTDSVRQVTLLNNNKLFVQRGVATLPEVYNIPPVSMLFRDTVTSNTYYSTNRFGLFMERQAWFNNAVRRQYFHGSELALRVYLPDSIRADPIGGDGFGNFTSNFILTKQTTGRSVVRLGSDPTEASSSIIANILLTHSGASGTSIRTRGALTGLMAYLNTTLRDTVDYVNFYTSRGFNNGGEIKKAVDFYAGARKTLPTIDTSVAFLNPSVESSMIQAGDFQVGLRAGYPIPGNTFEDGETPVIGQFNDPSVLVQFNSTTKGFLPMVMTTTQRDAIPSPATGLLIANSDSLGKLDYYNGSAWVGLGASSGGGGGGSSTWNGITDPTGVQSLTFGNGEYTEWTNQNDAEVFIGAVNNSLTTGTFLRGTTSSMTSGNIFQASSTSTALASGNELLDLAMSGTNGTSGITATGARISVTNTGTTSTNIGLAVTASGASTNYAIDATGTIRTSTSVDLPSSLTEGIKFAGTTRIADDGAKMRFSVSGGISQFYLSGTNSQIHVFNSGGSSSINLNGTTRALETVSSNLSIQPGATAKTGFGIAEGSINSSARVEIAAGTTTIGPLKFIAGTNLTTPVTGMHEYDGTQYYLTNSTPTRNIAAVISGSTALASGVIPAATTNGYLTASGFTTSNLVATSYTPTLTDVTNSTSASNAGSAYYYRKGNYIIVYGQLDHSATAGALLTTVDVSLPVASALTAASDIHGTATAVGGTGMAAGHVRADATNDRATIFFYAPTIGSTNLYYHFMYPVQ
jgi:hypothetical protein